LVKADYTDSVIAGLLRIGSRGRQPLIDRRLQRLIGEFVDILRRAANVADNDHFEILIATLPPRPAEGEHKEQQHDKPQADGGPLSKWILPGHGPHAGRNNVASEYEEDQDRKRNTDVFQSNGRRGLEPGLEQTGPPETIVAMC